MKRQGEKGKAVQDHEHPQRTRRHQYRYLFTAKHHGESEGAAQWSPDLSEEDEFAVFDGADDMELLDEEGNLYGALRDGEDSLRDLGIWGEQIAEFPCAAEEMPWHGYPLWAINHEGPSNRRNQKHRPAREVFNRMVEVGRITALMRTRLMKGGHV
jgi:hypothetical protein